MRPSETTIRLYSDRASGSEHVTYQEQEYFEKALGSRVVFNVSDPTLTVVAPDPETANGTAIVICPGGAFHILVIGYEGYDVAEWLAAKGVTCFILKYRVAESKTDNPRVEMRAKPREEFLAAIEGVVGLAHADGSAAIGYVRQHAGEYGIDPTRIGVIGFSAGGTVTASTAMKYTAETRPDFAAPIYPAYDRVAHYGIPDDAPPIFVAAATDDEQVPASNSIRIYSDWIEAGKSAELHIYAGGRHGFAMRERNLPCDSWTDRFDEWLESQGILPR